MDISTLIPSERIIEIKHPKTEQPLGIRVNILSLNDDKMKQIRRRFINKRIELEKRGKSFKADDIEANELDLLINCITSWDWYGEDVSFNGSKPDFNEVNVRKVLTTFSWFKDQVSEAVGDEQAFFQS